MNITRVKGNMTITSKTDTIVCDSSAAITLTLKSASGSNELFYVKNIGAGDVTVTVVGNNLIDGIATKVLAQYDSVVLLDYEPGVWVVI